MKSLRAASSIFTLSALASLAACGGGGGGGGGVTPPNSPGGPPPVSGSPSPGPSPTGSPIESPSPSPSASPTPATVKVSSASPILVYEDVVLGDQSWYTSGTASWSNHSGSTSSAPQTSADGMSCSPTQEPASSTTTYSQHAFVGIIYNGTIESLPQAIGMVNPKPPTTPYPGNPNGHKYNTDAVEIEDCEFNVHTHDFSGLVHIEDTSQPQSNTTVMSYANLQTVFDVWGAQLAPTGIVAGTGALTGDVQIFVGTPSGKTSSRADLVNSYALAAGPAQSVQLGHHTAVWIVIGQPPADGLPQIAFGVSY